MKQTVKISKDISSKILSIGPDYHNHRGGVGAVIAVYSKCYEIFNFIPTYKVGSTFYKTTVFFLSTFKLVSVLVFNRKIKIIHIHGASYGSFYRKFIVFFIGKYIFRKKVIYHIHGGGFPVFYKKSDSLSQRLIRTFLANADIVICLSQSWNDYFKSNFITKKLVILSNVIDYPEKSLNDKNKTVTTFLFFGLVCKEKGIFDLVEVIGRNKDKYRNRVKLKIGGNGEIQSLKELIHKHNIEDIVEFLGWVVNEEKKRVLNSADVFILPSYHEGVPISILEAMSYGKSIIATNVGGIPEIVEVNKNGLLIEPGKHDQIEEAINTLLEHPELIKEFGENSEMMVQKHLPHSVFKELEDNYKSILQNE
jgi:glycosyltransferase involved in cell wall biosynthesis